eukprot:1140086-Pelagomonas_calceolata.AAC.4
MKSTNQVYPPEVFWQERAALGDVCHHQLQLAARACWQAGLHEQREDNMTKCGHDARESRGL